MGKISMMAGAAVGYVFGTKAGRERYEQLKSRAQGVWSDPRVQSKASTVTNVAKEKMPSKASDMLGSKSTSTTTETTVVAEPSNNEGPDYRQPAPPMGIQPPPPTGI